MTIHRESLEMYLRVTYHMFTMMSHDYSGTLLNENPSVDTVHLKPVHCRGSLPTCYTMYFLLY